MNATAGPAAAPWPRVVLVEDDALIRRFVAMAVEDVPVRLVECTHVAEARAALRAGPAALVLTDLMLPGESGLVLAQQLQVDDALRGPARVAVFSAGLNTETRAALARCEVWRVLSKPVGVMELRRCVLDALAAPEDGPDAPAAAIDLAAAASATEPPAPPLLPADHRQARAHAVSHHFAGDAALYAQFRSATLTRLAADVHEGDAAVAQGDTAQLHRLLHSLKTVLRLLGYEAAARRAEQADRAAARGDLPGATAPWQALRPLLLAVAAGEDA